MWGFPVDRAASLTERVFGPALVAAGLIILLGLVLRRRRMAVLGAVIALGVAVAWAGLYFSRPAWLRAALDERAAPPTSAEPSWTMRADGIETTELELFVAGRWVDRLALTRIDPARHRFSVHWDAAQPRTVEEWQRSLGAEVVVNGTYYLPDRTPQTPLRMGGRPAGPGSYTSHHGAFVADARGGVDIMDLDARSLPDALQPFPEAMVSYPLLVGRDGSARAAGRSDWLATRSFVALDGAGRVLIGTTRTGFFSLRRLGEYLKQAPLDVRVALNLDGGPIASQAVATPGFSRVVIGTAEINQGADVLRAFWQGRRTTHWRLPIVLAVTPRS